MIKYLPLGGVDQIGGNISIVSLKEYSFFIDTGILFPREENLGINYLYPNFDEINLEEFKNIKYLFLTHAHEDHVGGILNLLKLFPKLQIIATKYTQSFVLKKHPQKKFNFIDPEEFQDKDFTFFNLRHSIPGVYGFNYFSSQLDINFLFVTDFRYDQKEEDSSYLNQKMIKGFSEKSKNNILFCDCTNIKSKNLSLPLESSLINAFERQIKDFNKDIYLTLFPSNVERLSNIIKLANKYDRPVVLSGLSLKFHYSIGIENGLIEPIKSLEFKKDSSIVLMSGSQGDIRGSFRRIISDQDKKLKPLAGDKLLFSSKPIPGNEKYISDLLNKASIKDMIIVDEGLHISGHAYKKEITDIYQLFKTKFFIPIHLESHFFNIIKDDALLSKGLIKAETNKIIKFKKEAILDFDFIKESDFDFYLFEQIRIEKSKINQRRKVGNLGVINISASKEDIHNRGIKIFSFGVPEFSKEKVSTFFKKSAMEHWRKNDVEECIRIDLRHYFQKLFKYKPIISVHLV